MTLANVNITAIGSSGNLGVGSMVSGGTTLKTDDNIVLVNSAVNTCFLAITGVWTYMPYDHVYGFLPLAAGTGTGVCPSLIAPAIADLDRSRSGANPVCYILTPQLVRPNMTLRCAYP